MTNNNQQKNLSEIISLCKRRGFIFQSCEIYGGLSGFWDLGPLGSLMKNNLRKLWLKRFTRQTDNVFLIEGTIIMHKRVWEASGHIENFTDPLMECKKCNTRFRADHLMDGKFVGQGKAKEKGQCVNCGSKEFTEPRMFNLMFKTFVGPVENDASIAYLRPETAQSMFTNFQNVVNSMRAKLPFGIAQAGKCFRNEITTGDFIFRSREFEIAEIEFFVKPGEDEKWFDFWLEKWEKFFLEIGIKKENLRRYEHPKESLAHYSKRTVDLEYNFPFGWSELAGVANRTDYDLRRHNAFSGKDLMYFDEKENKKYFPYVIEPTMGLERVLMTLIIDAFEEIEGGRTKTTQPTKEKEYLLKLNKNIAPIKVAILPLVKNNEEIVKKSRDVFDMLKGDFYCQYDDAGSIGRRYRRQDEIGTPYCITIDFDTLKDDTVTVRDRDTMEQERIKIKELPDFFKEQFEDI